MARQRGQCRQSVPKALETGGQVAGMCPLAAPKVARQGCGCSGAPPRARVPPTPGASTPSGSGIN